MPPPLSSLFSSHRSTISALFITLSLLVSSYGVERAVVWYIDRNWEDTAREETKNRIEAAQPAFEKYQGETLDQVIRIASTSGIAKSIRGDSITSAVFERIFSENALSLEAYSAGKRLVGWVGSRGPITDPALFSDRKACVVVQGPIYSYLIAVVPLEDQGRRTGWLVGKRIFDVNYPINNRFISNRAFRATFPSLLPLPAFFDFSPGAAPSQDSNQLSIRLTSIGSASVGFAYVPKPILAIRLEDARNLMRTIESCLAALSVALLLALAVRTHRVNSSPVWKGCVWTLCLWVFRYALIWLKFPGGMGGELFDPKHFASPFGYGLATSLGEMFISALFLAINVALAASLYLGETRRGPAPARWLAVFQVCLTAFLVPLLTRGFASLIHSAVFDSALPYNDPATVLPSMALSVMLVNLLLAALSVATVCGLLIAHSYTTMRTLLPGGPALISLVVLLAVASLLFGLIHPTPLLGQVPRLVEIGLFAILALVAERVGPSRFAATLTLLFAVALAVVVPSLDTALHEADRARTELLAAEIVRPEDSWMTSIVQRSLDDLAGPGAARELATSDTSEIEKLAFTRWAKSVLSREGNNCSVTYVRPDGSVLSDFHIGIPPHPTGRHSVEMSPLGRRVQTGERVINGETVKWYTGYAPIQDDDGAVIGGVWVEVSGGRQSLLRGESTDLLRSTGREKFGSQYRPVSLSEFYLGKLTFSTNEMFSLDRQLPGGLAPSPGSSDGFWLYEQIEGTDYESYYLPDGRSQNSWIALSLESLGFRWHFYTFLHYLIFYLALGLAGAAISLLVRGLPIAGTLRARLLASFVIVSLIPVVILAYYNRQYAMERAEETTERRLSEQTAVVAAEIQRQLGANVPAALERLTDEQCVEIANDLNTDFNIYFGREIQASSKPEMFTAELLDSRLSARAFFNLIFGKKSFFTEHEAIGLFPYVVGYRPIVAENGAIIGAVSVPTLYRQSEVEEELARRNVFLYGAYAIALFLSIVVGTLFANQISSPVRRLRKATEKISEGALDVELRLKEGDELGELERAFNQMTLSLKEARETMARTERELAWKEMAKQVAHEIKNPLTPIKLSIQHLRQAYADGVKDFPRILRQVSSTILEQIEALSRIASEFSHYARMPERRMQLLSAHDVLAEAENLFRQNSDVKIRMDLGARSDEVEADREELRRAFINILRNAVQAMEERGTITVSTREEDSLLVIAFRDSGPGISPEVKARLFEPSFSTKTDGMGLGLALVRSTVTDLGGDVRIESEPGEGTCVTIRLPLARPGEKG